MVKVITTKSAVQSDPNDDHYTKIVTFTDEEETDVYIPFPLEKTTTSSLQKSQSHQSHQLRQLPLALKELLLQSSPTSVKTTPRSNSTKALHHDALLLEQQFLGSKTNSLNWSMPSSLSTANTFTTPSPSLGATEQEFKNDATMTNLGKEIVKLLQESGLVKKDPPQSSESASTRKRRRDDDEKEDSEYSESRIYNCELEFDITTGDKVDNLDDSNSEDAPVEDPQEVSANRKDFTVTLQLIYVFKSEIDLANIPINIYITKSELIRYLMDRLVLRRNEVATDFYSIQSKIKKLLDLICVRCWINGYELDIRKE